MACLRGSKKLGQPSACLVFGKLWVRVSALQKSAAVAQACNFNICSRMHEDKFQVIFGHVGGMELAPGDISSKETGNGAGARQGASAPNTVSGTGKRLMNGHLMSMPLPPQGRPECLCLPFGRTPSVCVREQREAMPFL